MIGLVPQSVSRRRSSAVVAVGVLTSSLLAAGQALVLLFIVGPGEDTDAFLWAYSVYVPFAILGGSMRASLVPMLGVVGDESAFRARASDLISRVGALGLLAAVGFAAIAPLLTFLLAPDFSADGRQTTLLALLLLAPCLYLQIHSGAAAGTLNAVRRFPVSIGLYVLAATIGLGVSAALLSLLGVLGAALGLFLAGCVLLGTHAVYLNRLGIRLRPERPGYRDTAGLTLRLGAGAASGASQQLAVVVALSALPAQGNAITLYVYAYFAVGMLLNLSSIPLSLVTLPDIVEASHRRGKAALRSYLLTVGPYAFLALLPLLAALASFGEPLMAVVFQGSLDDGSIRELYDIALTLTLVAVPAALYYLAITLLVAVGRWSDAALTALGAVLLHAVIIGLAPGDAPTTVGLAQAGGSAAAAVLAMGRLLGRDAPGLILPLVARIAPLALLTAVFPAVRALMGWTLSAEEATAGLIVASFLYLGLILGAARFHLVPSILRQRPRNSP